ncbi:MAG: stealth family protein [Bacteroidetes bacterium]|nr:stealth family protein [Bacteroidota bacterium]
MKENYPIDFVVAWIDGNDPEWQAEYKKYYKDEKGIDVSISRFRDWNNLQYWFRCVERFAPWVRKIHLVTWGHLPEWLNKDAEKLNIVKHTDFIPKEYLPLFSALSLLLNSHLINGLAEHFVLFDDDMFLGRNIDRTRFFKKGKPVDFAQLTPISPTLPFGHYTLNNANLMHKRYNFISAISKNPFKWFNVKYGISANLKNLFLLPFANNLILKNPHIALPFLKSVYEKLWEEEFEVLNSTRENKFRNLTDITQWVMRYEQLLSGNFVPHSIKDTRTDVITDANAEEIANYIARQKYALFCINDSNDIVDFEKTKATINAAFEKLVPEKSSFER